MMQTVLLHSRSRWLSVAAVGSVIVVVVSPLLIHGLDARDLRAGHSAEVAFHICAMECGGVFLAASISPGIKRAALESAGAQDLSWARFSARIALWQGSVLALLYAADAVMYFFLSLALSS
jgi:hypothetical protein